MRHERRVRPHHIAYIEDVADRIQIADLDNRIDIAAFDLRNLARYSWRQKGWLLARTGVIERTGDDDLHLPRAGPQRELFLSQLAERVRARWSNGTVFTDWCG